MHCLSLSFAPTMMLALNKDFDLPDHFQLQCNAPPSMFAYPTRDAEKADEKKYIATAVLSTQGNTRSDMYIVMCVLVLVM